MDRYKPKFTKLQQGILRFLFVKSGLSFTARALASALRVSPTAIAKALKLLVKEYLIIAEKDKESGRLSIGLDKDNPKTFYLKRAENLKMLYECGLVDHLANSLPGSTIVLFGSYSFGEDIVSSDIDIALIGSKEKDLDLTVFSKFLERDIRLNFYESIQEINKNLKEGIVNGIVLKGAIRL